MKVLQWHVDKFIVDVKEKAVKSAEEVKDKHFEMKDGVVFLITLEKGDKEREKEIFSSLLEDTKKYINEVKADKLLLYPYAHLSSELLNLKDSMDMFKKLVDFMRENLNIEVFSSPFGWYKAFEVRVKGHPLSELSKRY